MLIKLERIYKTYRDGATTPALHNVNLAINKGEFVAIMGPSGSGKSTLMNLIGLLDKPTRGKYLLDEKAIAGLDDKELARLRRQAIGFVFQSFNLLPRLSVADNVGLPMIYNRVRNRKDRIANLLTQVGLSNRANFRPNNLSGGETQRVAIARALANQPSLILADEPTGNLDSKNGQAIMKILTDLNQQGNTIIVVTHDPNIAKYAKRVIQMLDGRIRADKARVAA